MIEITAKKFDVFIPLHSFWQETRGLYVPNRKVPGKGKIATADVTVRGDGVSQVTLGTLLYTKVPTGKTALFRIQATIRGKLKGQTYQVTINRINYKLTLSDVRYQQYLKPIMSDSVKFSS